MSERTVALGEHEFALIGEELRVGEKAPDVVLRDAEGIFTLNRFVLLGDTQGKTRLVSVIPSIHTSVCETQTRRMNQIAADMGDNIAVLTVSADLPLGQKSWCGAIGIDRVKMVSDHADLAFGAAYGTGILEMRLNQRALFVIDSEAVIRYAEYVPDLNDQPDYEAALKVLKEVSRETV